MKQLIKKIKELQNALTSHCCQVTLEQVLGMIEEQKSKPFNPLELGFELLSENEYIKYHFDNKKEYYILHLIRDNINYLTITLSIVSEYKKNNKKMIIAFLVKIPNHRFGKELLQNLGVIN